LSEAAKSRTPLLAGETPAAALTSNFRLDQHGLVESVGALAERVHSPASAADDGQRTYQRAAFERRPGHWVTGKEGADVASVKPEQPIGLAWAVDETAKTEADNGSRTSTACRRPACCSSSSR
jgi:hypothetical protein